MCCGKAKRGTVKRGGGGEWPTGMCAESSGEDEKDGEQVTRCWASRDEQTWWRGDGPRLQGSRGGEKAEGTPQEILLSSSAVWRAEGW